MFLCKQCFWLIDLLGCSLVWLTAFFFFFAPHADDLKVNVGKSEIVPVGQVGDLNALACVLWCRVGSLPITYLVMPLGAHCKNSLIQNPIIEKMEKRLTISCCLILSLICFLGSVFGVQRCLNGCFFYIYIFYLFMDSS